MKKFLITISLCALVCGTMPLRAANKLTVAEFIALEKTGGAALKDGILASFPEEGLKRGSVFAFHAGDFFFALETEGTPTLVIDDDSALPMKQIGGEKIWYVAAHTDKVSFDHMFHYVVDGKNFGGASDLPALGPLSYLQPGTQVGTLSEVRTYTSKIYDGMTTNYRVYTPAGYDPKVPAALMVFQDGMGYADRNSDHPAITVVDNLVAMKKIPMMVLVFVSPGDISKAVGTPTYEFVQKFMGEWHRQIADGMRSTEYDTVSDRYERFLKQELLAEIGKTYNIRQDGYSRGIMGMSSGGIAAFNAAWWAPEDFSRVISWCGSFGAHQWKEVPGIPDGGQDYPEKILREQHRNIRVWLADGSNDLEQKYGSWAPDNLRMANALKMAGYDFHYSFGTGAHSNAYGGTQFPEEMMWLWRDYDPAKTTQNYEMEASEKAKPVFRFSITNRDAK